VFLNSIIPIELRGEGAVSELLPYLYSSFGNETRIDYGTGHETNFLLFLLALFKIRIISTEDIKAVVCKVFRRYIATMRILQQVYVLEPAGSHGVWGLDDYNCLLFVWGAAQVRIALHPSLCIYLTLLL
jgi:hypothetical protein